MDRDHFVHLSRVLSGLYFVTFLNATFDLYYRIMFVILDSTVWNHVLRLGRSVLLDASYYGFKPRFEIL